MRSGPPFPQNLSLSPTIQVVQKVKINFVFGPPSPKKKNPGFVPAQAHP